MANLPAESFLVGTSMVTPPQSPESVSYTHLDVYKRQVEQRTENPCVPGSIPGGTTNDPCKLSLIHILC